MRGTERQAQKRVRQSSWGGGGRGWESEIAGEGGGGYLVSLAEFELSHNRRLFNFYLV
jgi:hypothetical protein